VVSLQEMVTSVMETAMVTTGHIRMGVDTLLMVLIEMVVTLKIADQPGDVIEMSGQIPDFHLDHHLSISVLTMAEDPTG